MLDPAAADLLHQGIAIPAHPLALDSQRKFDERRQVALTRYYCEAGAGGVAVGVHTTQFAIRDVNVGLFEPVLKLAIETVSAFENAAGKRLIKVAGICGETKQAIREARFAASCGYDLGLLSLGALKNASEDDLLDHCIAIAHEIPLFGFYLQPAAGGRFLSRAFWSRFSEIANIAAIKVAPFNRYQTMDVIRAVAESGRAREIALYTGNDDNIIPDLLTEYRIGGRSHHFVGGLLGQWAVWTKSAVELLECIHRAKSRAPGQALELLRRSPALTDANAAIFDADNGFRGCIAGIHEILRRNGLLKGTWCLDPAESLSPGQSEAIDRVCAIYPELTDDEFVQANLDRWLS